MSIPWDLQLLCGTVGVFLLLSYCKQGGTNIPSFCLPWCFIPPERLKGNGLSVVRGIFRSFSPKIMTVFSFYICFEFLKHKMFSGSLNWGSPSHVIRVLDILWEAGLITAKLWDSCVTLGGFGKPVELFEIHGGMQSCRLLSCFSVNSERGA